MKNLIKAKLYDLRQSYGLAQVLTISMSPVAHKHLYESVPFGTMDDTPQTFEGASVRINQSQSEDWLVFQG